MKRTQSQGTRSAPNGSAAVGGSREPVDFSALDIQFAQLMARLGGDDDPALAAAASLASRATANGDVCVHLAGFAGQTLDVEEPGRSPSTVSPRDAQGERNSARAEEADKGRLEARTTEPITAPPLAQWIALLRNSRVVGRPGEFRPLILDESGRLYLYRYWDYEKRLADNLLARAAAIDDIDENRLRASLERLFPDPADAEQKRAAAMAVLRRFCVISGGPGTGKTTTVVKILALLLEQARGRRLSIALAAPTGKAAARVQDALRRALENLRLDDALAAAIPSEAFTLHRLLGARPDSVHYRHHAGNPLPFDVLVVDEASMADLALATKLVEALSPRTRLILLGDKDQLASVEAGAVLGDICAHSGLTAAFAERLGNIAGSRRREGNGKPQRSLARSGGEPSTPAVPGLCGKGGGEGQRSLCDSISILTRSYRFGPESGIGNLARLVNSGDGAGALELLKFGEHTDLAWRAMSVNEIGDALRPVAADRLRAYFDAVRANRAPGEIFDRFNAFRILSAHRSGRTGVAGINRMIEEALGEAHRIGTRQPWYAGRPVMIMRNDYNLRLFNGDIGIALPEESAPSKLSVHFRSPDGSIRRIAPARLPDHETVYAMTIHKSQGSEFADVLIVLPTEPSAIMSRELVYTGITRAMRRVDIWGSETVFREAVSRRLTRASALRERLWHGASAAGDIP